MDSLLKIGAQSNLAFRVQLQQDASITFSNFIQGMIDNWAVSSLDQPSKSLKRKYPSDSRILYFRAHREIISARSSYFKTLFQGPWRDGNEKVLDFRGSVDELVLVLRFIYIGFDSEIKRALKEDTELAVKCLLVAHDYSLEGLQYQCEWILAQTDDKSPEDILEILNVILSANAPFLKMAYADFFLTNQSPISQEGRILIATLFKQMGISL